MDNLRLQRTPDTISAAQACIRHIERGYREREGAPGSPLGTAVDILKRLETGSSTRGQFGLINDRISEQLSTTAISAWPLWFSEQSRAAERPLFYMTQSPTSAQMSMLTAQVAERGIILNDIESSQSRWAKGAHPWLPLWLASNRRCIPFDPACGDEVKAICIGALQALYVEGAPGFCYMTLHDEPGEGRVCDRSQAYLGMYRLSEGVDEEVSVRLLGAGSMLSEVCAAAELLRAEWGIKAEVWSCPSYTKLARDAERRARLQRLRREENLPNCHLQLCLGTADTPVIAVTGYDEFVAAQLAAHVTAPFTALGADSLEPSQRLNRHWVVLTALRALVRRGVADSSWVSGAVRRYRLD
ncbi:MULTISPECIES: transketolase-like TK C-terminal-containing protein [Pseudomonas]|uniref:transketolase-like TK C-terminal-containing protein n=1 Tax=Pseudomonas TaxID=286 RepID=UPI001198B0D8|nr:MULTISPECIES: pyruvate dehydrogenase [Pseudomonas]MCE0966963.1 pyruvate dehydrogenase [Pseudomonas sp. NMI4491_12]MDP9540018.1 pyruvate dehydrogenase [Pseudomonas putida]QDY38874.1 pyruvate dehydrogenase [Pseudomonas putida]